MTKNSIDEKGLYNNAISAWGVALQLNLAIEECAELIQAISHEKRNRNSNIAEEIADVEIMCGQLRIIFGNNEVDNFKTKKLLRLKKRIENHNKRLG